VSAVSVGGVAGTAIASFSFDDAGLLVTSSSMYNTPPSGGAVLTVSGLRFGASDFTASMSFDVDCSTTSWTSSTTICCATGVSLSGASNVAKLTVSSVVSSAAGLSTFDGTSPIRQRLLLP